VFEIIMAEKVVLAALENDDDLLLLSSLIEEKVLAYQKLDIDNLTNDQCRTMFRFGREDINILSNVLRLPEKYYLQQPYSGLWCRRFVHSSP
jgi:hypothetical protein